MINIALVKQQYANMTDAQLTQLAKTEWLQLVKEARMALKEEFLKRNLDIAAIDIAEEAQKDQQQNNLQKIKQGEGDALLKEHVNYALFSKRDGLSNDAIYTGLLENGLDDLRAKDIVLGIETSAQALYDYWDSQMIRGGLFFIGGFAVTVVTYTNAMNGGTYIVAWGTIIFGGIRFFRGLAEKRGYRKILNICAAEALV